MKIVKGLAAIALFVVNTSVYAETTAEPINITVHRSPTCTCCGKWLEHLRQNGFNIEDIVTHDVQSVKDKFGINGQLASCHTAVVDGYAVEGHVPAADIKKLLQTKPKVVGLSVPGMVTGSPGMEMGDKKEAYQVVSFDHENHVDVFSSYEGSQ